MASLVKVIEILAQSPKSFDDALKGAVKDASKTVRNIKSVWIKSMQVEVENGKIVTYRITAKVSFLLDAKR